MARTVGIGKQNYEKVIVNNNFYVDKTLFIKEWWENFVEQHLTITHIGLKCYLFCILLRTFNCPVKVERIDFMAVALKEDYQRALDEQKKSLRACNGWIGTDKRGKDKRLLYCV